MPTYEQCVKLAFGSQTEYNQSKTGVIRMDVRVGDVLELKKEHPCGSRLWSVLRVGMDFKLRCQGCGHELMIPRSKAEKSIRKLTRPATEQEGQA